MTLVRVYIATTEGPSEVQRIAEEDPDVQSVVCLNGTSQALPISQAYNAFARKPTGVIERYFGHPVFRLDVARRIEDGRSWQLGVFLAHALKYTGKLAESGAEPDHVIWVTGEVNNDLAVAAVDHVSDKLKKSDAFFAQWEAANVPVTVIMPQTNAAEGDVQGLCAGLAADGKRRIEGIATIAEAGKILDLHIPGLAPVPQKQRRSVIAQQQSKEPKSPKPSHGRRSVWPWAVPVAALVLVAGVGVALWTSGLSDWIALEKNGRYVELEKQLRAVDPDACSTCQWARRAFAWYADRKRPVEETLKLQAVELRAPVGRTCTGVGFGRIKPEEKVLDLKAEGTFPESTAEGLCGMAFRVTNAGHEPVNVWMRLAQSGRVSPFGRGDVPTAHTELMAGENTIVHVTMPRWTRREVSSRVAVVVANRASQQLETLVESMAGDMTEERTARRMKWRLRWLGVTVLAAEHRIKP